MNQLQFYLERDQRTFEACIITDEGLTKTQADEVGLLFLLNYIDKQQNKNAKVVFFTKDISIMKLFQGINK